MKHQVKQVNNKKLLSFDDEEEEDGLNGPVVSFQQASGVVKKEDLKREIKIEKKEEFLPSTPSFLFVPLFIRRAGWKTISAEENRETPQRISRFSFDLRKA